jgi:protein phosphatase
MQIKSSAFTHRGGVRAHNEDACFCSAPARVWVVADGMGGHQCGDIASRIVCNTVERSVVSAANRYSAAILHDALQQANQKILAYAAEYQIPGSIGSTVVALTLQQRRFTVLWAGDSRCYRLRRGQLQQLTRDHSQVEDMIDLGQLDRTQAEHHPLSHIITRAVGVDPILNIAVLAEEVHDGDIFLLCSDGISKEFSSSEILRFIQEEKIEDSCLAIEHAALVKKSKDNVTCVIVQVQSNCYAEAQLHQGINDATLPLRG